MVIRKAEADEYLRVRDFYYELIDHIGELEYTSKWKKGIYPEDTYLETSVSGGDLFLGLEGNRVLAGMIVNTLANDSYAVGKWSIDCEPGEYMVIHILGVMPSETRKGHAKEMVRFALEYAKKAGMKAVRLDVLKGNRAAEGLYPSVGFVKADELQMYYEDTGWTDFILYSTAFKKVSFVWYTSEFTI